MSLSTLHPLPKLVMALIWLAAAVLVFDARFQLALLAAAVFALTILEQRSPLLVLALMVPFALFGFGFLTTSLLFREEGGFAMQMARESLFDNRALSAGMVLFLRALACGMISALFALTTDAGALIKALMVSWRLPPRIGYALFSAMQLVPDLAAEAQQIRLARAMHHGRPPSRVPGPIETASLIVPLLAFAIRRAGRAAISMEARGLTRDGPRTVLGAPVLRRRDGWFVFVALALLAVLVGWSLSQGS